MSVEQLGGHCAWSRVNMGKDSKHENREHRAWKDINGALSEAGSHHKVLGRRVSWYDFFLKKDQITLLLCWERTLARQEWKQGDQSGGFCSNQVRDDDRSDRHHQTYEWQQWWLEDNNRGRFSKLWEKIISILKYTTKLSIVTWRKNVIFDMEEDTTNYLPWTISLKEDTKKCATPKWECKPRGRHGIADSKLDKTLTILTE